MIKHLEWLVRSRPRISHGSGENSLRFGRFQPGDYAVVCDIQTFSHAVNALIPSVRPRVRITVAPDGLSATLRGDAGAPTLPAGGTMIRTVLLAALLASFSGLGANAAELK